MESTNAQFQEAIHKLEDEYNELEKESFDNNPEIIAKEEEFKINIQLIQQYIKELKEKQNEVWKKQQLFLGEGNSAILDYLSTNYTKHQQIVYEQVQSLGYDVETLSMQSITTVMRSSIASLSDDMERLDKEFSQATMSVCVDEGKIEMLKEQKESIETAIQSLEEEIKTEYQNMNIEYSSSMDSYYLFITKLQSMHSVGVSSSIILNNRFLSMRLLFFPSITIYYNWSINWKKSNLNYWHWRIL